MVPMRSAAAFGCGGLPTTALKMLRRETVPVTYAAPRGSTEMPDEEPRPPTPRFVL